MVWDKPARWLTQRHPPPRDTYLVDQVADLVADHTRISLMLEDIYGDDLWARAARQALRGRLGEIDGDIRRLLKDGAA